jgi:hypothetical protein
MVSENACVRHHGRTACTHLIVQFNLMLSEQHPLRKMGVQMHMLTGECIV